MHAYNSGRGKMICCLVFELMLYVFTLIFQYKIGQLYMIAKHSHEQSQKGEGVEVIENRPHEVKVHI